MPLDIQQLLETHRNQNYQLHRDHINPVFARVLKTIGFDRVYTKAQGPYLWDSRGAKYLDFMGGWAVLSMGRNHPTIKKAIADFLEADYPSLVAFDAPLLSGVLAAELKKRMPNQLDYVFFTNSGTEGIEAALKFARARAHAKDRPGRDIVAFTGGFHGRTGFALSATWNPSYRAPFEPLVPGVRFLPFNDPAALDEIDASVCAVIVEPVQGEAGAIPARSDFLEALRARCDAADALLVFDEVQSGMGRTGRFLAAEHYGVRADVVVLSKALGGGLPLGAVLLNARATESLAPGMHGTTFGGNAVAAVAGLWMLERVANEKLLARVRSRGKDLMKGLRALVSRHRRQILAAFRQTRGCAQMTVRIFGRDAGGHEPSMPPARTGTEFLERARERSKHVPAEAATVRAEMSGFAKAERIVSG